MKHLKKALAFVLSAIMMLVILPPSYVNAQENETAGKVVDVTEFGADPTGEKDSAEAVKNAIDEAKKLSEDGKNAVTLLFPEGRYDFYPDNAVKKIWWISNTSGTDYLNDRNKNVGILFEDCKNMTLDGGNSLFMFHGKMTTIATEESQNITFKNFTIDFEAHSVIDMVCESVDSSNRTAVWYIPGGASYTPNGTNDITFKDDKSPYGKTYWSYNLSGIKGGWDKCLNLTTGELLNTSGYPTDNATNITDLGNRRVQITYSSVPAVAKVGNIVEMRQTERDHTGAFFWLSKGVTLENMDVNYMHGFGMVSQHSENMTFRNVNYTGNNVRGFNSSSFADSIHFSGCYGQIEVDSCNFTNPHDDPINIHGTFLKVTALDENSKTVTLQFQHHETCGFPNYFVGDEVQFVSMDTLMPLNEGKKYTVESVTGPSGTDDTTDTAKLKTIKLVLNEWPQGLTANNMVCENMTTIPNVNIHDCVFTEDQTRGLLVTSSGKVEIKNNIFDSINMSAIYISDDANYGGGWYESGNVKDVTISGNTFYSLDTNAIFIEPTNRTNGGCVHSNINITDNTFYTEGNGNIVNAKSVDGLKIENNKIYREYPNVSITPKEKTMSLDASKDESKQIETTTENGTTINNNAFSFNACKNVTISGNVYDGAVSSGVSTSSMSSSDVTIKDKTNTAACTGCGTLYYESSNTDVAVVDDQGNVTGIKEGEADITIYGVAGDLRYEAKDKVHVTVTGEASGAGVKGIEITAKSGETECESVNKGEALNLTAKVTGGAEDTTVSWSVEDATTFESTQKATINADESNGNTATLNTSEGGLVCVVAKAGTVTTRKLLSIKESGGRKLASHVTVENQNNEHFAIEGEELKVKIGTGHTNVWIPSSANPANRILIDTTKIDSINGTDNLTIMVTISGQTINDYEEAALLLYSGNSYIWLGRKHNGSSPGATFAYATNNSPTEESNHIGNPDSMMFKLVKSGNDYTGYYKTDGEWTQIGNQHTVDLGSEFKISLYAGAGGNTGSNAEITFSDLHISNNEGDIEQETSKVPLTELAEVGGVETTPTIEDIDNNGVHTLNVDVADILQNDGDIANVRWAYSDTKDGEYSVIKGETSSSLVCGSALSEKCVKAAIIPGIDDKTYGDIEWSEPIELSKIETSSYSANAYLGKADFTGLKNKFNTLNEKTNGYFVLADSTETEINYDFAADDENAEIEVIFNGETLNETPQAEVKGEVELSANINVFHVIVTAEGGEYQRFYRFCIFRQADNKCALAALKIGDKNITLTKDKYDYDCNVTSGSLDIVCTTEGRSTAKIYDGTKFIGEGEKFLFEDGETKLTIPVTDETGNVVVYYHITVNATPETVDKSTLQALVDEAEKADTKDCTEESVKALNDALKAAKEVLEDDSATAENIKSAAENLQKALDGLTKANDRTTLEALVKTAEEVKTDEYTEESVAALNSALKAANDVLKNEKATADEIKKAADDLQKALDELIKVTPEPTGKLGDVNSNKEIDTGDVTLVLQYIAGIVHEGDEGYDHSVSDVTGDEVTDTQDVTAILQYIATIITKFPAEG